MLSIALSKMPILIIGFTIISTILLIIALRNSKFRLYIESVNEEIRHIFIVMLLKIFYSPFMLNLAIRWEFIRNNLYKSLNEDTDLMVTKISKKHGNVTGNLNLVLESTKCKDKQEKLKVGCKKPLYVQRRHLTEKYFWKKWAFSIVVLRNKLEMNYRGGKYTLKIDLTGQSYGIYNNDGKKFLKTHFFEKAKEQYKDIEKDFIEWIKYKKLLNTKIRETPFRWASAGVLPIVKIGKKYYIMLIFRTIPPIGWNLPLGASETKSEYKNLRELMLREFHEEVLIVNRKALLQYIRDPQQRKIEFKNFTVRGCSTYLPPQTLDELYEHLKRHVSLREKIDEMVLSTDEEQIVVLHPVETPFEVEITYDTEEYRQQKSIVSDVIFTINPFEQGIDILGVYEIELDENVYPLTGELTKVIERKTHNVTGEIFIREPILLLSIDKVREMFKNENLFNEYLKDLDNYKDGSIVIPELGGEDYIIEYLDAIDIRRSHVDKIFNELSETLNTSMLADANNILQKIKKDIWEKYKRKIEYYENNVNGGPPIYNPDEVKKLQKEIDKIFNELLQKIPNKKEYTKTKFLIKDLKSNLESVVLYFPQLAYIRGYHKKHGSFPNLRQEELKLLLTLCPATWKSLSIGVKFGIFSKFFSND
ncbi:hypothetical protein [Thermococcus sp. ES12]|uniref:hypothetical protein n=1 Tax=Thermococcus sp. ES12 TaxID=1638246 RepID=UPI00142FD930|nr:hypothetical protein [Thermococcus sp. ES12]NJE75329.1 hypothetical protein [Thermococcus sp. ES12]